MNDPTGTHERSPFAVLQSAFELLTCDPASPRRPRPRARPRLAGPADQPGRIAVTAAAPLLPVRHPRRGDRLAAAPRPDRRWRVDSRAGRRSPAWPTTRRVSPGPGLPRQDGGYRSRNAHRSDRRHRGPPSRATASSIEPDPAGPARRRTSRTRRTRRAVTPRSDTGTAEPPRPFGHPDLVLIDAVADGVISAEDAELIGATRLGDLSLADAAVVWGCTYKAVGLRRWRAESALSPWLQARIRDGFEAKPAHNPGSNSGGRPRQGHRSVRRPGDATTPPDQPQRRR